MWRDPLGVCFLSLTLVKVERTCLTYLRNIYFMLVTFQNLNWFESRVLRFEKLDKWIVSVSLSIVSGISIISIALGAELGKRQ